MVDFAPLIVTAQRLIGENGRSVTLVEFDSTLSDAARPWLGPADPRTVPDSSLVLDAVFVEPSSGVSLGLALETDDLIKNSDQIMIVSAGAAVDLTVFGEVIDGSTRWKIETIKILKPGSEIVLGFVGVRR